jgi:hypothetical protein
MTQITLTVSVRKSEVEALRKVCAMNDVTLFVHEVEHEHLTRVTFSVLSAEAVFYLTRTLDELLKCEKLSEEVAQIDAERKIRRATNEQSAA